MDDQLWTLGKLLNWTVDFLKQKGADSPRLDAEVLLAHARGCQRIELYTAFEEVADEGLRTRFRELVKQRAAGKPVAYLVGRREFFSLPFEVTSDVLIPRPETEAIVVRALDAVRQGEVVAADGPVRIVDVGTGSGILAVCLAIHLPDAQVWAIDVSPAALAVARRNAARHGVEERITWIESDLFAALEAELDFHVAVSNPPYVTTAELERLDVDVRKYEPRLALDGGPEGTAVIERLLDAVPQRLTAGGRMLVEISPTIVERVERLAAAHSALRLIKTHRDLSGQARIVEVARTEIPA